MNFFWTEEVTNNSMAIAHLLLSKRLILRRQIHCQKPVPMGPETYACLLVERTPHVKFVLPCPHLSTFEDTSN